MLAALPVLRVDQRLVQPALALAGVAALGAAVVGAQAGTPSAIADADSPATLLGAADSSSKAVALAPTDDDVAAELRSYRSDSAEQAGRDSARSALTADVPVTAAPTIPAAPVTTPAWTTDTVNVRAGASQDAEVVLVAEPGTQLAVTGRVEGGYAEIVSEGRFLWVHESYVAATPPTASDEGAAGDEDAGTGTPSSEISGAPCATGSAVESGLVSNAINVHRAVCALFPQVSSYGGLRSGDDGDHGTGRALDIMISSDVGTQIAEYLRANAGALGVESVIWRQQIWTVQRAGEGWRWMEDRGSTTANHRDHVHVSVY